MQHSKSYTLAHPSARQSVQAGTCSSLRCPLSDAKGLLSPDAFPTRAVLISEDCPRASIRLPVLHHLDEARRNDGWLDPCHVLSTLQLARLKIASLVGLL